MSRRPLVLVTTLAAVLTACGPQAPLELNLRTVALTVPRIPTPAVEMIPPAPAPLPVSLPAPVRVGTLLPPPPPPPPPTPAPAPAVEDPCPPGDPTAAPERSAGVYVTGLPAEDQRTERATTNYVDPETGDAVVSESEIDVTVRRLGQSEAAITGQLLDDWVVERVDTATGASSATQFRYVHESDAPGATNPGIWLVGMAWSDPSRGGDITWEPAGSGLWLLPSPVVLQAEDGVQYVGTATDPRTTTTVTIVRNVTGRDRVNACGEYVEGYVVGMTGTFTAPGFARELAWELTLATGYGGIDVESSLALTSPAATAAWSRTTTTNEVPEVDE